MSFLSRTAALGLFCIALTAALPARALAQDAEDLPDPETTEVWEPVPPVVVPGATHRMPPSDAVVLFDGHDLSAWQQPSGGSAPAWTVEDGAMMVTPGGGPIETKQTFGDVQLHVEWRTPSDTTGFQGQDRGNSGIFLQGRYEVQVLDSYKSRTYSNGQAGSIYKQYVPAVNASTPPGTWQSYDIVFIAPRFREDSTLASPARLTVFHNGVLLHNDVELKGGTVYRGAPNYEPHPVKAPIMLQDHNHPVRFRNIWLREINAEPLGTANSTAGQ